MNDRQNIIWFLSVNSLLMHYMVIKLDETVLLTFCFRYCFALAWFNQTLVHFICTQAVSQYQIRKVLLQMEQSVLDRTNQCMINTGTDRTESKVKNK